ncbi:MAG: GNAT family N-acetyltransferase [Myxococcota bacterium]|nr:GNAT family N-acetyltransferase [Myxococcota bacterium]
MESGPDLPNLELRRASESDASTLADLARLALPLGGYSEVDFLVEIGRQETGAGAVWLTSGGEGGAVVRLAVDEAELLWLAVAPDRQRCGLGRRLLKAAIDWAEGREAALFLEVRESNGPALALYRETDFVVAGRRARYYRDGEDALLLRRLTSNADRTVPQTDGEPL